MSNSIDNHLISAILDACQKYPNKIAHLPYNEQLGTWSKITFSEFNQALLASATYWKALLNEKGLVDGSVVGVW